MPYAFPDRIPTTVLAAAGVVAAVLLLAISLLAVPPAEAQQRHSDFGSTRSMQVEPDRNRPSGTRLPTWAEPGAPSPERGRGMGPQTQMNPPGPPDNPSRVPLSGIEWLLVAGLGYGTYRLRHAPAALSTE
jgi:hypothetical protein